MKKQSKKIGILAALAVGITIFLILNRNQPAVYTPPLRPPIPLRPASNKGQAFNEWVLAMIKVYGASSDLFKPGGAFYNIPKKDIYDAINPSGNPYRDYA